MFVTAATEDQKTVLETKYGVPQSHIFSSEDDSFVAGIFQATNNRGVDVVVNTLSGDLFFDSCKCVADSGSMLDFSKRDSSGHEKSDRSLLANRSYYSFDMVTLLQKKPSMAQRYVKDLLPLIYIVWELS